MTALQSLGFLPQTRRTIAIRFREMGIIVMRESSENQIMISEFLGTWPQ